MFRIGFGYDVHRLVEGRPLVIGGVIIPYHLGLEGHSDADILTHAIMDALLGALALGDIGMHFPDTDPAYRGMESLIMAKIVKDRVAENHFRINNLDSTIVAERPKMAPHIPFMKERLSEALEMPRELINIKATTTEGLGFTGREKGIAAFSVVSLVSVE